MNLIKKMLAAQAAVLALWAVSAQATTTDDAIAKRLEPVGKVCVQGKECEGVGAVAAPQLFKALGITPTWLFAESDGTFPNFVRSMANYGGGGYYEASNADVLVSQPATTVSFTPDTLGQLSLGTRHLFDEAFIRVLVRRLHAAHEALAHPRRIM